MTVRSCLFALILSVLALPQRGGTHPHAFIDGGLGFVMADGQITHLSVTWIHDPLYTLFAITEAGLDPDGDGRLSEAEVASLVRIHQQWIEGFAGDSYLWADDQPVGLSKPQAAQGRMLPDGRFQMEFVRALDRPVDPRLARVTAKAYDPTYYTAYALTEAPAVRGDPACRTQVTAARRDPTDAEMLSQLALLDRDDSPEDPSIGVRFADTISLQCD
ncbi:DUF1007 family protein [Pseudooceanicola sp.]|uniref:DUF1007 family protein n=1 Tax=Pseudooceanicola sp. TaxID=1914328 RepID=UPI002629D508|nr:DUF1007 family protein [Pseudooceanicola sp.]MDF1855490.1 DUF1007 family protein [Pseudooceanicola sp.]